jgi:hypothetical protein
MMDFSRNLSLAKVNKATNVAAQKGGKMTVFSFGCWASPCSARAPSLKEDEDD